MIADEDPDFQLAGPRMTVWSKYLAMHARKQFSFVQFNQFVLYCDSRAPYLHIGSDLLFSLSVSSKYVKVL